MRPATSTRPSSPGCWPASATRRSSCSTAASSSGSWSSGRWCSEYPAARGDAVSRPSRSGRSRPRWRMSSGRSAATARCWWMRVRRISTRATAGAQMRHGHIPGAINHYWQDDLTQEGFGHVWKPRGGAARGLRGAGDHARQGHHRLLQQRHRGEPRALHPAIPAGVSAGADLRRARGRSGPRTKRPADRSREASLSSRASSAASFTVIAIPLRSCPGRQILPTASSPAPPSPDCRCPPAGSC